MNENIFMILIQHQHWYSTTLINLASTCKRLHQYVYRYAGSDITYDCELHFVAFVRRRPVTAKLLHIVFENVLVEPIYTPVVSTAMYLTHLDIAQDRALMDHHIAHLHALQHLHLPKNKCISDAGLLRLDALRSIDLSANTRITNASIMTKYALRWLRLLYNQYVNDAAFTHLHDLNYLDMGYNTKVKAFSNINKHAICVRKRVPVHRI